jgi:DNA-binding GntR family transcriptional regulator
MPATKRPLKPEDHVATSKVVTDVFEAILADINSGRLLPGDHISDTRIAADFGVSRTPVREAIQRLREIGLVEAAANRFTRVAIVSTRQTANALIVWVALFGAVLDETIPKATDDVVDQMRSDHAAFSEAVRTLNALAIASTNFQFFNRLTELSDNPELRNAIRSVVHLVRLGSLLLPEYIDLEVLGRAQELVIDAAATHSVDTAREAMRLVRSIDIPQSAQD